MSVQRDSYRPFAATVARVEQLSPSFRRVVLTDPDLGNIGDTCLDQRAKLILPLPGQDPFPHLPEGSDWFSRWRQLPEEQRNPVRTITLPTVRREQCEVDVEVALHGDLGPLSRWAAGCRPGDPVVLVGPDAHVPESRLIGYEWRPDGATDVLLAGDETAVPAIMSILQRCPRELRGHAWLEVPSSADRLPLLAPKGIEVHWLPRDAQPHPSGAGDLLVRALTGTDRRAEDVEETLWDVATHPSQRFAWIAGEASAVRTIRRHLVASGWSKASVAFMGYWRSGHAEL